MKKIVLSLLLVSLLAAPAVFARDGEGKNVDAACVSTAVGVRETALLAAWSKFDDAVTAVLTARKTALISAWALTDVKARKEAVKAAWATARKDRKAAVKTYKQERKEAWATFKKAAKECGGNAGGEASGDKDSGEEVDL
jgi:hypothetical protein